jgi:hypothetical protein
VLAVVGSVYAFAARAGIVPDGTNPARGINKFKENRRERFLTGEELERLGRAIREGETRISRRRHPKEPKRRCRRWGDLSRALGLRHVLGIDLGFIHSPGDSYLHLRWEHVDVERLEDCGEAWRRHAVSLLDSGKQD